jgi:hypothetical protein
VLSDANADPENALAKERVYWSVGTSMTSKLLKLKTTATFVCGMYAAAAGLWAQSAGTPNNETFKALLDAARKDLRTEKQAMIDQAMALEAGDKAKFWAIYQSFQKELDAIWDVRLANVRKYAENYQSMSDAVADQLVASALDNEQQLTALKKKYHAQFKAALGARRAARWLQAETTVGTLAMLQLLSEVPLLR